MPPVLHTADTLVAIDPTRLNTAITISDDVFFSLANPYGSDSIQISRNYAERAAPRKRNQDMAGRVRICGTIFVGQGGEASWESGQKIREKIVAAAANFRGLIVSRLVAAEPRASHNMVCSNCPSVWNHANNIAF